MSARFLSLPLFSLLSLAALGQAENALPQVNVQNLKGSVVNTATWGNDGKPIIISFWATWCKPCIKELANIHEVYGDWQEETGVKLIAVSIDDTRTSGMVRSMTLGRGWEYDIYLDVNSDLKRAMNVVNVPHTFLLDGQGRIVYQHTSYADGDEEELFRQILDLGQ